MNYGKKNLNFKEKKMKNGSFICFDGTDKSGKSTIISLLKEEFEKNKNFIFTREPGSEHLNLCSEIRSLVKNKDYDRSDNAELLLFMADRANHFDKIIIPNLEEGKTIITDRCYYSTFAYQIYAKNKGIQNIDNFNFLNNFATHRICPDLTFFFYTSYEEYLRRGGGGDKKDQFEKNGEKFFNEIKKAYLVMYNESLDNKKENIHLYNTEDYSIEDLKKSVIYTLFKFSEKR